MIRTENNERIGVYEGKNNLTGYTGDLNKGIKADLNKIEYITLRLKI